MNPTNAIHSFDQPSPVSSPKKTYVDVLYELFGRNLEFYEKMSSLLRVDSDDLKKKFIDASTQSATSHLLSTKVQIALNALSLTGTLLSGFAPAEMRGLAEGLSKNLPNFLGIIPGQIQRDASIEQSKASLHLAMLNDSSSSKQSNGGLKNEVQQGLAALTELRKIHPNAIGG